MPKFNPGDKVVLKESLIGNEGKVFTLLRVYNEDHNPLEPDFEIYGSGQRWLIDRVLPCYPEGFTCVVSESTIGRLITDY